eukprot:m.2055 g.2055  ORF g.2055 m.2055 type:complete len:110 (+) comp2292_c0_seq1:192-521(+)
MLSLDLMPESAGTVHGIQNTFGSFAGVIAPLVTGFILDAGGCSLDSKPDPVAESSPSCKLAWRRTFLISAFVMLFGSICFTILAAMCPRFRSMTFQDEHEHKRHTSCKV